MIEKLKSGAYRVRLYHHGRYVGSETFRRKTDAVLYARTQTVKLATGLWVASTESAATVGEWMTAWQEGWMSLKPSTVTRYKGLLDNQVLSTWRLKPLTAVAPSEVRAWAARLVSTASVSTAGNALGLLRQSLDAVVAEGHLARNPADKVRLPKLARSEPAPLTHAQLWSLVEAARDERDKVLLLVLGYGGMRWSEVVALRIGDVKDGGRRLRLSEAAVQVGGRIEVGTLKDHKARTVVLPQIVADRLKKWIRGRHADALVFASSRGTYLHNQNWRRDVLTPAADSLGLTITPHNLRDTAATLEIAAGASVTAVARMLGHENPATTLKYYAGCFPDDLASITDRLDGFARQARNETEE